MSAYQWPLQCVGAVTGATGAAIYTSPGGPAPARTAKGTYTLTFEAEDQFDATQASCFVQVRGAAALGTALAHTSDTVKTIVFLDNLGAAQDADFDYKVIRGPLS